MASDFRKIALKIADSQDLTLAQLGLRFDRVALDVLDALNTYSEQAIPARRLLLFTMTAPIRHPAKSIEEIEAKITRLIATSRTSRKISTHGNEVQIRIIKAPAGVYLKFFGLIHNPTTKANTLFEFMEEGLSLVKLR